MLAKKFWILVVCVLIGIAIGATFWGQHIASQEPVKVINPVPAEEVDASKPATPKPPPPGETAESGHWHGDEWHAEPHEAHTPVEVTTPEAQEAQMAAPTQEELEIMQLSGEALDQALYEELNKLEKGSQAYNEFAEQIKWFEKNKELSEKRFQTAQKLGDALEEAAKVSETEEQIKKEWNRILAEMESEMLEAERLYQEHQKKNPLEQ